MLNTIFNNLLFYAGAHMNTSLLRTNNMLLEERSKYPKAWWNTYNTTHTVQRVYLDVYISIFISP